MIPTIIKYSNRFIFNTLLALNGIVTINQSFSVEDSDLEVKRAALLMINTAIHHNPSAVSTYLAKPITPILLETLKVKMERVVDLGPFKHKVDDNLPLRKVALTCVESILDSPLLQIDAVAVMAVMPTALADKEDIKLQAHQVQHYPTILLLNIVINSDNNNNHNHK